MIKKIVLVLLALAAVYGAVMSPYSLTETLNKKATLEGALANKASVEQQANAASQGYIAAKNAFDSNRSFEIAYNDLAKIKTLIDAVSGVDFQSLSAANPDQNFIVGERLNIEDYVEGGPLPPAAIVMSIYAADTASGLDVINRLELPVVKINVTEPGRIEVTFLTGGES